MIVPALLGLWLATAPEAGAAEAEADVAAAAEAVVDVGDVDAIRKRGVLRVLVFGEGETSALPRDGSPALDREAAEMLAESLGVVTDVVSVERFDNLIPLLLAGRGDVIAARMTETPERAQQIAFSLPAAVVSEVVVGRRGAADLPRSAAALAGKTVVIRPSASYREGLQAAGARVGEAAESVDEAALVAAVATGTVGLTVCDSDLFANITARVPGVEALFALREGRQIALGIRKANPKLKVAADAVLLQHALTGHQRDPSTLDLKDIKKRGSLRVLLRNNATGYFLYKGVQQGFDFEFAKQFARENGLRIDAIVPPDAADVIPWLLEGRADVIATAMTVTPERGAQIDFSSPYLTTDQVLVQPPGEKPLKSVEELAGRSIHVRRSSSYRTTLEPLAAKIGFTINDAAEDLETEELIAAVAAGDIPLTVADSAIAAVEIGAHGGRKAAQATLVLKKQDTIAFGVRKNNPELKAALDRFVKKRSGDRERLRRKYFARPSRSDAAHLDARVTGKISPFDATIKQYSERYGIDWRLMAAQAYQESFFDPKAQSWCGAVGLFQVMPRTGRALGFKDLHRVDDNIHAGVKYMGQLIASFDPRLPFQQRVRFALASYNAGPHHVQDARDLAKEMGLDADKWFGNVEKAMLRLEDSRVYRKARHGYCRGSEPVKYVSDIQSRYDNWVSVFKTAP